MSARKIGIILLYFVGVLITLILTATVISKSEYVLNQNAMLPTQLWEQATVWLALGTLPMSIASLLFYKTIFTEKPLHHKRKMILICTPAIICTGFLLYWLGIWIIGFLNLLLHQ